MVDIGFIDVSFLVISDNLKTILDNYVTSVFPGRVKILRPNKPLGLIRARIHGIREATGDVIAVMDSHMEVQEKW